MSIAVSQPARAITARGTSVAFAADDGIVAALPVVKRLLEQRPGEHVLVFYGTSGDAHDEPVEELLALKDLHLDRLAISFVTDREPDEAELLNGRLDEAKVGAVAARLFDARTVREFFVCGSAQLVQDVNAALERLGVDPARIHVESDEVARSSAEPVKIHNVAESSRELAVAQTKPAAARETQVVVVMDGRRRSFSMLTGEESILDAAARAGVDLPFSCKAGVCSTCRTKLMRGEVELAQNYALEDWELQQGFILACQAHAKTPEIEITYDET